MPEAVVLIQVLILSILLLNNLANLHITICPRFYLDGNTLWVESLLTVNGIVLNACWLSSRSCLYRLDACSKKLVDSCSSLSIVEVVSLTCDCKSSVIDSTETTVYTYVSTEKDRAEVSAIAISLSYYVIKLASSLCITRVRNLTFCIWLFTLIDILDLSIAFTKVCVRLCTCLTTAVFTNDDRYIILSYRNILDKLLSIILTCTPR